MIVIFVEQESTVIQHAFSAMKMFWSAHTASDGTAGQKHIGPCSLATPGKRCNTCVCLHRLPNALHAPRSCPNSTLQRLPAGTGMRLQFAPQARIGHAFRPHSSCAMQQPVPDSWQTSPRLKQLLRRSPRPCARRLAESRLMRQSPARLRICIAGACHGRRAQPL